MRTEAASTRASTTHIDHSIATVEGAPQARERSGAAAREHPCANERRRTRWPGARRGTELGTLRGSASGSDAAVHGHRDTPERETTART
jgi:hypothetical protein